jgi:hypothetical protein
MCEYCEKPIGDAIVRRDGLLICVVDGYPSGKEINGYFFSGGFEADVYCKINYCPMCGRKLDAQDA